jgi:hypothetical protein
MRFGFLFLFLILNLASAFGANITFENFAFGQMRATGHEFVGAHNKQVNIYKNGDFLQQIQLNPNGSFSYTTPKNYLNNGDRLTVKVLQYLGNSRHYEKTGVYSFATHSIEFSSLGDGQMRVVGRNLNDSRSNDKQINFYNNGKYIDHIFMNPNGSFSYTAPMRTFQAGDNFTVKVLNYLGNGNHLQSSAIYKPAYDDYIEVLRACQQNTSSRANEELCVKLRVPAHISFSCNKNTSSTSNEALCLQVRTNPETARACYRFMSNSSNEEACLKTVNLSPERIEACNLYTSSSSAELNCILNARR